MKSLKVFKNELLKNVLCFLIATIVFVNVSAQIIYTDIPDTQLVFPEEVPGLQNSTNYFYFDLDNNGTDDFYFAAHYWEEWLSPSAPEYPFYVLSLQSINNLGIPIKLPEPCAFVYDSDDTVQSSFWSENGDIYVKVLMGFLNCDLPYQDRYIGLRLSEGADHYYGWIRLDASTDTLLFKDYAYNSTPNETIFAGQTEPVGVFDYRENDEVLVYFDGQNIRLKSEKNIFESYSIFTIEGKRILDGAISSNIIIEQTDLIPGLYLIKLKVKNSFMVKKILIR